MTSIDALTTSQLTKLYPISRSTSKRVAVDQLDLAVKEGEIFGFLGPNGAGKTTTIKMLLSFIRPSSGDAWIFGKSVEDESARAMVGYVPEQPYFPKFLTCLELVKEHGILSGLTGRKAMERAKECLTIVKMDHVKHTPLSQLSKGMTQRVGLACAIVGEPKLLILDEPSSGLDPVGRRELREMLTDFKAEGKTIFVSSHLLSEMESVCDRVGVIANGKLVACGAPEDIVEARDQMLVEYGGAPSDDIIRHQVSAWGGQMDESCPGEISTTGEDTRRALVPSGILYNVIRLLQQREAKLHAVTPQRETLEEAFLRLVKGAGE